MAVDTEEYRTVKGFPTYGVNEQGEVINLNRGRHIHPHLNQYNCLYVSLTKSDDHRLHTRGLAKLVAGAYLPKPFPHWDSVIHLDFDQSNCAVSNLAWRPRWFAIKYQKQAREKTFIVAPLVLTSTGEIFANGREAVMTFGILETELLEKVGEGKEVFPGGLVFDWH